MACYSPAAGGHFVRPLLFLQATPRFPLTAQATATALRLASCIWGVELASHLNGPKRLHRRGQSNFPTVEKSVLNVFDPQILSNPCWTSLPTAPTAICSPLR